MWAATLLGSASLAHAQQPTDLTSLSLQELMAVDVISINVLGSHIHPAGQWMIGYGYAFESMDGNRDGTRRVSRGEVLERFATSPTDMTMHMHMIMGMYAPTNDLTLMAMLPYVFKSMNNVMPDGTRFTLRSDGIGDLQLRGLYTVYETRNFQHRLLLNGGISFPTGSIDEKDFGPDRSMGRSRLEYAMQLGSGTFDLSPGVTYLGQSSSWAWGAEFIPTVRLGTNANDYRLGNRYRFNAWGSWKWTEWLGLSGHLEAEAWDDIHGADRSLDPMDAPTKDTTAQGGRRVDLLFGINLYAPSGFIKGQRLSIEVGAPVYQSLNGPQLQNEFIARVGWQWAF